MKECLIISKKLNNVIDSISYILPDIDVNFEISLINNVQDINKKFSHLILIDCKLNEKDMSKLLMKDGSIIIIGQDLNVIETNFRTNYIKTDLVKDKNKYSSGEKDFLFKKNIYNILNKQVIYLLSQESEYLNGAIIDISNCKSKFDNGIFEFSSISESYSWLTQKLDNNTFKEINYMLKRIYNDSDKEIRYLVSKIRKLKEGKILRELFICNKEEIEILRKNVFFKLLIENIGNGEIYIVSKDKAEEYLGCKYEDIFYGIIIYDDCVYRDYLDNEYTLGFVDCKKDTINKYNEIFDDITKNIATKVESEGDLDEIF